MLPQDNLDSQVTQFLALNQQVFAELLTFVDFADKFTIGFVEINFNAEIDMLIEALKSNDIAQEIQFETLQFNEEDLRFLLDEIVKAFPKIQVDVNKKLVLIVRGLEKSIGTFGEYPPVLQDLNFVRDAYKYRFPYPMLFVLPDYAITRLAKFAPDFWAWRSGVFLFKTTQITRNYAIAQAIDSDRSFTNLKTPEKQERIELLESLLMEYDPSHCHKTEKNPSACSNILHQLGVAYLSQRNPVKAKGYLEKALKLTIQSENLPLQAEVHKELGEAYNQQRQFLAAITSYQSSLEIARSLENYRGEANALYGLGNIYKDLRDWEQAIKSYQQCLTIEQQIGDIYSQANTYQQLGWVAKEMSNLTEAEGYYQQALQIYNNLLREDLESVLDTLTPRERDVLRLRYGLDDGRMKTLEEIGYIFNLTRKRMRQIEVKALRKLRPPKLSSDMAYSWKHLGDIERYRGNWDKAERLYQQSLELMTELGDREGMATTWRALGDIERNRGNWDEAERLFRQSLELSTELGDRSAMAFSCTWLGGIEQNRGNWDEAEQLCLQSLELSTELGDRSGMAFSWRILGYIDQFRGNWDEAERLYRQSLEVETELGNRYEIARSWGLLSNIELRRGNWDETERLCLQSLAVFTELGDRHHIAQLISGLGAVELGRGNLDAAEQLLTDALERLQEQGDNWFIAQASFHLAQVWQKRNNTEIAQQHYNTAHQIFQQLGAAKDLERIEREWESD